MLIVRKPKAAIVHNGLTTRRVTTKLPSPAVRPSVRPRQPTGPSSALGSHVAYVVCGAARAGGRGRAGGGNAAPNRRTEAEAGSAAAAAARRWPPRVRRDVRVMCAGRRRSKRSQPRLPRVQRGGVWAYSGRCGAEIRHNTRTNVHVEYSE